MTLNSSQSSGVHREWCATKRLECLTWNWGMQPCRLTNGNLEKWDRVCETTVMPQVSNLNFRPLFLHQWGLQDIPPRESNALAAKSHLHISHIIAKSIPYMSVSSSSRFRRRWKCLELSHHPKTSQLLGAGKREVSVCRRVGCNKQLHFPCRSATNWDFNLYKVGKRRQCIPPNSLRTHMGSFRN
jgi:hypothetical protein